VPDVKEQDLPAEVGGLLAAIEEREPIMSVAPSADWSILVRLMGEPRVENRAGERATFAKKRSLELLCWMVLNRDRSTRSAARTAMWDLDVADSTFSTIVSEMRRALRRLDSQDLSQLLSRPTYSDSLPLSASVVADVELLDQAVHVAAADPEGIDAVAHVLGLVRDVPFAGATYQWADLDGSTTRVIISVMQAVDMVISVGQQMGRADLVLAGTRAGLRVMPGDQRLLAIQASLVPLPPCSDARTP
jgi:two-component SAPR family response regulator